jgi:arylsulfatase A-like enzyme
MSPAFLFRRLASPWLLAAVFGSATLALPAGAAPPNFVIVVGEGAGWVSTSVPMDPAQPSARSTSLRTPGLERLAAAGLRFAQGYAASPRCTPSRAALFTGRSPGALHMTFVTEGGRGGGGGGPATPAARVTAPTALMELPAAEITLAELLQEAGYATAHFGKWHVGRVSPARHGFAETDGPNGNGGPENVANPNPKQGLAITEAGVAFLERQARSRQPFYLHLSHYPSQEEKGAANGRGGRSGQHEQEVAAADQSLARILDTLDRLGLRTNTYILYTTDHGTPGRNGPLRGGKGTIWEGGLRVPFLLAGPGIAPNANSAVRVSALDVLPTFAELAGRRDRVPAACEGGSLVPLFQDGTGSVRRPREEFVVHFPHYDKDPVGPASALFLGDLKLVRIYATGERRLYDVAQDPAERRDLAPDRPDRVRELDARLTASLQAVGAAMPTVNESVPAGQRPPERRGNRGGGRGAE